MVSQKKSIYKLLVISNRFDKKISSHTFEVFETGKFELKLLIKCPTKLLLTITWISWQTNCQFDIIDTKIRSEVGNEVKFQNLSSNSFVEQNVTFVTEWIVNKKKTPECDESGFEL